jgi:hypothetical protein
MLKLSSSFPVHRLDETENEPFYSFTTKEYKLHYFESLTGLRFALTTDPSVGRLTKILRNFYKLYVDMCVKNPLYKLGTPIDSPQFLAKIQNAIETLPFYD